jgi:hypothetical protein
LIATRFPFGFLRKTATLALQRETIVYPALESFSTAEELLDRAAAGENESASRGMGRDFYRIRPYEPDDSARHIDWKSSAHTGQPHIREYSREERSAMEIYLDRRTEAGHTRSFEAAVERCAFLVSHLGAGQAAHQAFADTTIFFSAQGFEFAAPADGEFYGILRYLALVEPLIAVTSAPDAESHWMAGRVRVVFSSRPADFRNSGWADAWFVGNND